MKKGFTLIELLTVIAIIGILTSIVVVSTGKARSQARDAKRKSEINTVSGVLEMYYANQRIYPTSNGLWIWTDHLGGALNNFISAWPLDPTNTEIGFGKGYVYCSVDGKKYAIDTTLEGSEAPTTTYSIDDKAGCSDALNSFFTGVYLNIDGKYHSRVTNK